MDEFLTSGPSRVKILGQECFFFFLVADTYLKQIFDRHGRLYWIIAWIKDSLITLSLFPSISSTFPLTTYPSFTFSWTLCPKYNCGYPGCNISIRITSKSLPHIFPPSSYSLSNIQPVVHKELPLSYRDITSWPSNPNSSHCQPCTVTRWPPHLICIPLYVITYLTQISTPLKPRSHEDSSKN